MRCSVLSRTLEPRKFKNLPSIYSEDGLGVSSVPIPAQSPNRNPHAERFIKSIRNECLDHFIVFGGAHLGHLVREYVAYYNAERYHQGLGGKLLTRDAAAANDNSVNGSIKPSSRLGGTSISTNVQPLEIAQMK